MQKIKAKIKLLHPDAKMPLYASEQAACFDLYSVEDKIIPAGKNELIAIGISIEIPEGHCIKFWDRSGMGVKGIHHFAGVIDSDYRGELKVILHNSTSQEYKIEKGTRIVQAAILPVMRAEFEKADELSETKRGEGGFHSTGKN
jgi:dUTP pyrophosphatase